MNVKNATIEATRPCFAFFAVSAIAIDPAAAATRAIGRSALRRVFLLIDSRRGLRDNDIEILDMLDSAAVNYQIVLTKTDKIKPTALADLMTKTAQKIRRRPAAHPELLATSSVNGDGIEQLRAEIAKIASRE